VGANAGVFKGLSRSPLILDTPVLVPTAISGPPVSDAHLVGELSLDGSVRGIRGALPIAVAARARKIPNLIVPEANAREAAVVSGLKVYPVRSLLQVRAKLLATTSLLPEACRFPVDPENVSGAPA